MLVGAVLNSHIVACRAHKFGDERVEYLKHSIAVIIPESNLVTISTQLVTSLRHIGTPNCIFMNEDNNKGAAVHCDLPGSITTRKNKPEMVAVLLEHYFKKARIVFSREFISAEAEYSSIDNIHGEFITQLRAFSKKKKQVKARDGTFEFEIYYSGKISGGNDDFVLCLLIGVYNHGKFFSQRKYQMYWH